MINRQKLLDGFLVGLLCVCAVIVFTPVFLTVLLSAKDGISSYLDFYIWKPSYLAGWVNSFVIATSAAMGSVIISIPAAYVFAKVKFRGSNLLFYLYIIVMMMPFQVTLLPQYIVSKSAEIYDTPLALILPGIFSPFAVFLLTQVMKSVPNEIIEAARLETASTIRIILSIIIPSIRPGIVCSWILVFTEQWNSVAEPLILIESKTKFPLAVLLNEIEAGDVLGFAATTVFMLLPMLLFAFFKSEIREGLGDYRLK